MFLTSETLQVRLHQGVHNRNRVNVSVNLDSEQIVTPRFAEKVSDQLSINEQSGGARR